LIGGKNNNILQRIKTKTMLELKDKGLAVAVTPDNNPYEEH